MMNHLRLAASKHTQVLNTTAQRFFASKELVINAVGSDRLGIVSDMTKCVTDVGGNVGESQAARLGSYFSLMMVVTVPEEKVDGLVGHLNGMTDLSATAHVAPTVSEVPTPNIGYTGRFTLEGADHPGIVHSVTTILAGNGMSIARMVTSDEIAPHGGTTLFRMSGLAHAYEPLAHGFDVETVKEQLSTLGDELNCDIDMEDVNE